MCEPIADQDVSEAPGIFENVHGSVERPWHRQEGCRNLMKKSAKPH